MWTSPKNPRNKRAGRFRPAAFPDIEKEVAAWITEKRQGGIAVSTNVICLKAKSVTQRLGIAETLFKASQRWCYGFMERYGFSIRRRTTIAQWLPQDYKEKLIRFQRYVIAQRKKHDFELKYIGNTDQTPLTFDIVTNATVSEKGVKSVSILTTGHEKDRFTVMLACLRDGTKLPPYVIFKRKTLPKNANFPKGVIVRCQEKGWMDQGLVQDWLRTVWSKVGGFTRKKSMLVWDSFRAHSSAPICSMLKSLNTEPIVIPGGMTSMVQPLDVAINKPFKDRMRKKWQEWILADQHTFTASGRIRKVELTQICQWMYEAWEDIPNELIKKSFRKYCITNAMDGTEDDHMWEDDSDPFAGFDEDDDDVDLLYADSFERQQADIDPESYENLFGDSDC